jgi:predicted transcriptional regulator
MELIVDWKKLISELIGTGLTQTAIAKEIGVTQGAIAQVLSSTTGSQRGFKYEPGAKLVELHRQRVLDSHATT